MTQYHEPEDELSDSDRNVVRALMSLKEEIEAVNWYHQRVSAGDQDELAEVLAHNRDEEIEHACMALEWLRREMPEWDENLDTYLFTDKPLTEIEEPGSDSGENGPEDLDIGN